ncbi:MAG: UDP-N-acetylmuramate dehydrogenase [Clostridia bacterium]|nr:UDP-N-acetylmuramate dehydrogenase [Clostridia bacterium]
MPYQEALEALFEAFRANGILCKWNEPLAGHTSFKIGGRAALSVWPTGRAQIILVLSLWRDFGDGCPLCVLGKGSNVLISDKGFCGLVVITTKAKRVVYEEDEVEDRDAFRRGVYCHVYTECGASLTALALACGDEDRALSGLEFAYGIPGTVGGAIVMNAGAYGSDVERVLISAEYYDLSSGEIATLMDEQMELDYRHSIFLEHPEWVVLSGVFKLSFGNGEEIRAKMRANIESRREKQPLEYPSAGSVFKRPVDNFAAKMIDTAGLKGVSVGGAQVSEKHAGFIINRDNATADDVRKLVCLVRDEVEKLYRYRLECEIRYVSDGLDGDCGWEYVE